MQKVKRKPATQLYYNLLYKIYHRKSTDTKTYILRRNVSVSHTQAEQRIKPYCTEWASEAALVVKNLPASAGDVRDTGFAPWVGKILWRRTQQLTPVFLSGESHGQTSLVGYNPQGCKEFSTTEAISSVEQTTICKDHFCDLSFCLPVGESRVINQLLTCHPRGEELFTWKLLRLAYRTGPA